ncbi:MAG: GMC family oxidoreductase [SAR324 cluster bacterium]|nr:GMC family oxidoreductase [SAR324 cluster bacterium]
MLISGQQVSENAEFSFDLCIIGAGAAGISIARVFNRSHINTCLLESGGFEYSEKNNRLNSGEVSGVDKDYLNRTRLRMFGGATGHWAGYCRPLDTADFEKKEWLPQSVGWPFERQELISYYDQAAKVVQIKSFFSQNPDQNVIYNRECGLRSTPFHFSPPTRFGTRYRKELVDSKNISIMLHSNAVELKLNAKKDRASVLKVVSSNQKQFSVKAKVFVLATGGLENPRFLLNSNGDIKAGLGNQNELVHVLR